jgi:hypothetical protein
MSALTEVASEDFLGSCSEFMITVRDASNAQLPHGGDHYIPR